MSRDDRILTGIVLVLLLAGILALWQAGVMSGIGPVVGGVLVMALLYLVTVGRDLLRVLAVVLMALLPLVILAACVIWFAILPNDDLAGNQPALIAGTVIATGWIATFLATVYQREALRKDTRRDVLYALRSEVFTIIEKLDKRPITEGAEKVQDLIRAGGDDAQTAYFPFSTSESPAVVFQAVSGDIALLRAKTLELVLRFYAAFSDLTAMVEDTRSADFKNLEAERRIGLHRELTAHRRATLYWGLRAMRAVNRDLGVKPAGDIPRSGQNQDITL